ncbi:MAG: hypothetical protein FWC98_01680, partial [Bacteroidales bacterium]|nr:hypothetical protein [Bacteroidales bacterium]
MQSEKLDVYLAQFAPEWGEVELSLERLEKQIAEAFDGRDETCLVPTLIVLPEMFSTGFKFFREVAEPM